MARLLLLDASVELLENVQGRLQELGHEVVACSTGKQALACIEDSRFDVCILDLDVGDVSAFDLTTKIAANPINWSSPIVVLTASPQPDALFKVMNAGASFVLAKPFAFATLVEKIGKLLSPRDSRKGAFDPALVRGFLDATVHILGRLGGISVGAGKPFVKTDGRSLCEVNALVDVKGGGVQGSLCFSFHPDTLETLLGSLFAYEQTHAMTGNLVRDAIVEITNLVVGHAKRAFRRDQGIVLQDFPARFLKGAGVEIPYAAKAPVLVVPFTVQSSWPFYLEFCLMLGENEPFIPGASPARNVFEPGEVNIL